MAKRVFECTVTTTERVLVTIPDDQDREVIYEGESVEDVVLEMAQCHSAFRDYAQVIDSDAEAEIDLERLPQPA